MAGQTNQRKRILIVDDEEMVLRALARILGRKHDTTTLSSPKEALCRLASCESWDIILSDVMMPQMNGVEFARRVIEACPELAGRIILMTGGTLPTKNGSAPDQGAPTVIAKPVDLENLQRLLGGISLRTGTASSPSTSATA